MQTKQPICINGINSTLPTNKNEEIIANGNDTHQAENHRILLLND